MIWLAFLIDSIAFGAIFIFGATGEILTEKAGHLNLGIPGIMCMGGTGGVLCLNTLAPVLGNQNPLLLVLSVLSSFLMAGLMGLIYSFLTVTLRVNQNVTGLALTTFGSGLNMVIMSRMDSSIYLASKLKAMFRPFTSWTRENLTGSASKLAAPINRLGVLFFLAIAVAIFTHFFLYKTKKGLNLRAVGENPATADAVGINVTAYKYVATCVGSGIAGLGGFYYIIDYMGSNEAYKSIEAFGWLAIALVIFSLWKPIMAIFGSIVFGFLFNCASPLATIEGLDIVKNMSATHILNMLPYLVTIIVLIITSIRNKRENQPPASLGMSYFREER